MTTALVRPDVLYAWAGPSLLVVNTRGQCGDDDRLSGFHFREARFLRTLRLEINGEPPWVCEAAAVAPELLNFTLIHPEIVEPGGGGTGQADDEERTDSHGLPERALGIRLAYTARLSRLDVLLTITNHSRHVLEFELAWMMGADFADIQETQGPRREQQAPVDVQAHDAEVEFAYRHPQLPYRTRVSPGGSHAWRADGDRLAIPLRLGPQESIELPLRVVPSGPGITDLSEDDLRRREAAVQRWRESFASVSVPGNRAFEQALQHNIADFASFPLVDGEPDEWLALQAGMPLYPALFGRDALTAGWQAGYVDRAQALAAALTRLSRMQSSRVDDWRDEEPGRIPYQVRTGPLAALNVNPYSAYYADFASPLMFVISLANFYAWTGDTASVKRHLDTVRRILDWAREYGDRDGDGYLEYLTRSSKGTKNQGWKDSGDAVIYDDGTPVPPPIGTCELQAYWYAAQQLMGVLCWMLGDHGDAKAYVRDAADLKARFNRDWCLEDTGFFALAMDPEKRLVRAATSNVGHCLAAGIIDTDHVPSVVGRLFAPDLFSGWGVRTLSSEHAYYNPLSYHRGTVWAVEQATIIFGLRRFGFDARALDLAKALCDLAQLYPEHRIPECVGGYARGELVPGAYPRANTPQLWNATSFALVVQTMLGLLPLAPVETLVLDPVLPTWIPEMVLHGLKVGQAQVSLRFWREENGRSEWEVLQKQGTLRIVRQPPPESLTAGWIERAEGLVETVTH